MFNFAPISFFDPLPKWLAVSISLVLPFSVYGQTTSEVVSNEGVTLEQVFITGGQDEVLLKPGSATLIDEVALDKFEYTDINRVLNAVPGVNIQEEDGYGLRPNIGLRGTSPERSKKITIMEDGILSGPAPYSAPAAYYFPNISRMSAVEVFKGPSTIQYGPATVGGAINMVSRAMPYAPQGELDVQYGSDNFQRYNAYYGEQVGDAAYVIEGLRVSADGFKDLDGGGDTGFVRNDVNLKTSWQVFGEVSHSFLLKLGYADEESDETYLGLTEDDFNSDPNRRYSASQLDKSEWQHLQFQFTHSMELNDMTVTSDVYRNDFDRDWFKVNAFNSGVTLQDVLADPSTYDAYYNVLTGSAASDSATELQIGNNGRKFISQGLQTRINSEQFFVGLTHNLEVGVRYHQDEVERHHTEQNYAMQVGGELIAVDGSFVTTVENKDEAQALALYIQDEITLDNTTLTLGVRHETIESTKTTFGNFTGVQTQKEELSQSITLPGAGVYSQITPSLGLLAGIYKGFTAATPNGSGDIEPEESTNYEFGARYSGFGQTEVIAFVNDYSQFSGTCSVANSCDGATAGEQINAGSALVYGVEASWKDEIEWQAFELPMSVTYTFSHGEFGEDFTDESGAFGEAGLDIKEGYEIGYLPEHRLNLQLGVAKGKWAANASALYQSEMRNVPGQGNIASQDRIDTYTVIDLSANYQIHPSLKLYGTLDNALGNEYVVSAKPYGFRPGKPRSINIGAKYQF